MKPDNVTTLIPDKKSDLLKELEALRDRVLEQKRPPGWLVQGLTQACRRAAKL